MKRYIFSPIFIFINTFVLHYLLRKFGSTTLNGSTMSIDQPHTCPMTNVMVCSGLNHKNCQSWSRSVDYYFFHLLIDQFHNVHLISVGVNRTVYCRELPHIMAAVLKAFHNEYHAPLNAKQ